MFLSYEANNEVIAPDRHLTKICRPSPVITDTSSLARRNGGEPPPMVRIQMQRVGRRHQGNSKGKRAGEETRVSKYLVVINTLWHIDKE